MTSFQIAISPKRRAAGRFISAVRKALIAALAEEHSSGGMTQAELARRLEIDRSVINRELKGEANISIGRIGELAWALGRKPKITFEKSVSDAAKKPISARSNNATRSTDSGFELELLGPTENLELRVGAA